MRKRKDIPKVPPSMNIYSPKGTKVEGIFVNGELWNGYEIDKENASKYIKENIIYTVDHIDVDRSHSDVFLEEFPGIAFNSVHFTTEIK